VWRDILETLRHLLTTLPPSGVLNVLLTEVTCGKRKFDARRLVFQVNTDVQKLLNGTPTAKNRETLHKTLEDLSWCLTTALQQLIAEQEGNRNENLEQDSDGKGDLVSQTKGKRTEKKKGKGKRKKEKEKEKEKEVRDRNPKQADEPVWAPFEALAMSDEIYARKVAENERAANQVKRRPVRREPETKKEKEKEKQNGKQKEKGEGKKETEKEKEKEEKEMKECPRCRLCQQSVAWSVCNLYSYPWNPLCPDCYKARAPSSFSP